MELFEPKSDSESEFNSDQNEIDCYDCFPQYLFDICDRDKSQHKRIVKERM